MVAAETKGARAIWQLTGGPASRSYVETLLNHGVALIGPGDAGPWRPERGDDEFEGGFVRRFACEVARGDVFLLRTGVSNICGVGLVASDYIYLNQFDDVNGWDLQHARRVRWCRLPGEYDFGAPVFGANPPRFSRTWGREVIDFTQRFLNSPPIHWQTAPIPDLPPEEPPLDAVPAQIQGIVAEAQDLVPLLWDRRRLGEHPSEDELVAHLVVPFLRSLGWPPERIAVKWQYVDVAVFKALPRNPENCQFLIEAKRLGAGVEGALEQAKRYAQALAVSCDLIVTDGARYRMYDGAREFKPIAYANLARLKRSAVHLFSRMKRA